MTNRKIIATACIAMMAILAMGCQKEPIDPATPAIGPTLKYQLDGRLQITTLDRADGCADFIAALMAQVRAGSSLVLMADDDTPGNPPDANNDPIVFETTNEQEAIDWAAAMRRRGYDVTVAFSNSTQVYTCTAVPAQQPAHEPPHIMHSTGRHQGLESTRC